MKSIYQLIWENYFNKILPLYNRTSPILCEGEEIGAQITYELCNN